MSPHVPSGRALALLAALSFCAVSILVVPSAQATNTSCTVSGSSSSCSFSCDPGSTVQVSGQGIAGAVSGTCGAATATCVFAAGVTCTQGAPGSVGGSGTCSLDGTGFGTCGASGGSGGGGDEVDAGGHGKGHGKGPGHGNDGPTGRNSACVDANQPVHTYGQAVMVGASSSTLSEHGSPVAGFNVGYVDAEDTNVGDCNGDGVPGDFDGDYDFGVGGAFFGSSATWDVADGCGYDLNVHAATGVAADVTGLPVRGLYGVDDVAGPTVVTDPTTGATISCQTDGSITPDTDANDCFTAWTGSWSPGSCAFSGGDDGYWLFLEVRTAEVGGSVDLQGATAGTLAASF